MARQDFFGSFLSGCDFESGHAVHEIELRFLLSPKQHSALLAELLQRNGDVQPQHSQLWYFDGDVRVIRQGPRLATRTTERKMTRKEQVLPRSLTRHLKAKITHCLEEKMQDKQFENAVGQRCRKVLGCQDADQITLLIPFCEAADFNFESWLEHNKACLQWKVLDSQTMTSCSMVCKDGTRLPEAALLCKKLAQPIAEEAPALRPRYRRERKRFGFDHVLPGVRFDLASTTELSPNSITPRNLWSLEVEVTSPVLQSHCETIAADLTKAVKLVVKILS
jgi:hypothetical protein